MKYIALGVLLSIPCHAMFVRRDATGSVVGIYSASQPGVATEELADADPAISAFKAVVASRQNSITAIQFRKQLSLTSAAVRSSVESFIGSQPQSVKDEWQFTANIYRNSNLVALIQGSLGYTNAQIDAFFAAAKSL
jgi:hypothetical protein